MGKFEDLNVWQNAVSLVVEIYQLTNAVSISKNFGMKDQLQRSTVSIPSNIVEGDELQSQKQSIKHFYIAKGSCAELFTQLLISA